MRDIKATTIEQATTCANLAAGFQSMANYYLDRGDAVAALDRYNEAEAQRVALDAFLDRVQATQANAY